VSLKKNKNHFFRKLGTYWRAFAYSMPIRLVVMQLRQHPVMVAIWGIVYSVLGGGLLGSLGAKYVLLEPEYLGKVDFLSFLWEGAAFGAFVFAYHLSLYIHVGYRFPFLVLRRAPFFTFVINNSILPIFFLILYATEFLAFQSSNYGFFSLQVGERLVGFLMGALVIFAILSSTFFATSKNLFQYFGENIQQEFERQKSLRRLRFFDK
jgi:hypothetical protein